VFNRRTGWATIQVSEALPAKLGQTICTSLPKKSARVAVLCIGRDMGTMITATQLMEMDAGSVN